MKKIFHYIKVAVLNCLYYLRSAVLLTLASAAIGYVCWTIYDENLTKIKVETYECGEVFPEVSEIYVKVKSVTEVSNRVPKLCAWTGMYSLMSVNAFTTGHGIYMSYASMMSLSTDELALIIGHEMAHGILHHTDNEYKVFIDNHSNEDELMADNMGAFWANKAGYNVCKGRELFKKFGDNSLNGSHPPNRYRYENLEHYCRGK